MISEQKLDDALYLLAKVLAVAGSIVAVLILTDFLLPETKVTELVKQVNSEMGSSHRNRHASYKVSTSNYSFYCEKDFFVRISHTDTIVLQVSPLLKVVNAYFCDRFMEVPETFSLRYVSGLALPVLMCLTNLLLWRIQSNKLCFIAFLLSLLNFITLFFLI